MIHSVAFTVPDRAFTCPVSTFMVFSSMNQEENLEIINCFHNIFKIEQVIHVSNQNGLQTKLIEHKEFSEVSFNKCDRPVQPLFWVKIKEINDFQNHHLKVNLSFKVFARYFYLLLIDANRKSGNNIDCGEVRPEYNLIRIRS